MSFCLTKITSFSPRHYVILSTKNICLPLSLCHYVFKKTSVSLSVPLLFCLQKNICLPLSLCHYVFKKNICLSLSHSVILSKNVPVGDGSKPSCCCYCYVSFCLISIFHKLYYVLLHYFSLIYSFLQGR